MTCICLPGEQPWVSYILIILVILLSYFWPDITLPVPYNHLIYPGEEDSSAPKGSLKNEKKPCNCRVSVAPRVRNGQMDPGIGLLLSFKDFNSGLVVV